MFVRLEKNFFMRYQDIESVIPYTYYYYSNFIKRNVPESFIIDLTQKQVKKRSVIITDKGYYILSNFKKEYIEQLIIKNNPC